MEYSLLRLGGFGVVHGESGEQQRLQVSEGEDSPTKMLAMTYQGIRSSPVTDSSSEKGWEVVSWHLLTAVSSDLTQVGW